jgi:hypothetical protein
MCAGSLHKAATATGSVAVTSLRYDQGESSNGPGGRCHRVWTRVESAIRATIRAGSRLPTPTGRAEFEVGELDGHALVLLFGAKRT